MMQLGASESERSNVKSQKLSAPSVPQVDETTIGLFKATVVGGGYKPVAD